MKLKTRSLVASLFLSTAIGAIPGSAQDNTELLKRLGTPNEIISKIIADANIELPSGDIADKVLAMSEKRSERSGGPAEAHIALTFDETITEGARESLQDAGVELLDKVGNGVWFARVGAEGAKNLENIPGLAAADIIPLEAKLSQFINPDEPFDWQRRDNGISFSVLFHKGVTAKEVRQLVGETFNGSIEGLDDNAFSVTRVTTIIVAPEQLAELAASEIVQFVEPAAAPDIDHNQANAQPLSNVDDVQVAPFNLSGAGVTVGVWEAGDIVRPTHEQLTPRVTVQPGQTTSQDGHALHVAGTIGASGNPVAAAEGMAPAVNILSWDSSSDATEMTNASATTASPRIVASNHSYGIGIGNGGGNPQSVFGNYTNQSVAFDNVVVANDLVVLKSAGNDRNDTGALPRDCTQGGFGVDADCLGPRAVAKNVITVGAMAGGAAIANFSSFGPTDDGRTKPDIVARGTNMTSTGTAIGNNDDVPQQDDDTWIAGGTSMSTPVVTGIVALMFEEFASQNLFPSASSVKAILLQTARDVNGVGQATVGPDFATGYGIADAEAAMTLLRRQGGAGFAEGTLASTGGGGAWDFPFVMPSGEPELRVTLAWSDPAGTPTGAGSELVNDLDLRLIPPGGGAGVTPWRLNPANPGAAAVRNGGDDAINNVEQVSVLNPAAGTWTVRVTAKAGSLALGPQSFSIAGPITPDSGPISGPKANIMMVLDKSGSMALPAATPGLTKMEALQDASTAFVDYVDLVGGHNLGITAFDGSINATSPAVGLQPLASAAANARIVIGNLSPGGLTNIIAGVQDGTNQISGPMATNADDVIFLFSDGRHNTPSGSNVNSIDSVMANSTRFFSVGFGTDVDSSVLTGVATNHDGIHLEEQSLEANQLVKLFMVVAGLATDETIVIDPDYSIAAGSRVAQRMFASTSDRAITFATAWETRDHDKLDFQLVGPNRRCKIPLNGSGVKTIQGNRHALTRVTLPYKCVGGPSDGALLHAGEWQLRIRNKGQATEKAKVVVLADSGIGFDLKAEAKGREALVTARLLDGDKVLSKGVRVSLMITPNRPSKGDSKKQDQILGKGQVSNGFGSRTRGSVAVGTTFGGATTAPIGQSTTLLPPSAIRTIDRSQFALDPQVNKQLLDRAQQLQLSPEILEQLRGRFVMMPKPQGITMRDDGTKGDRKAGDGVFSVLLNLPESGRYQIRARAEQGTEKGVLTREALGGFVVK